MMETLIAVGVGVVVAGGILTLVWRILTGDRQQKRLDEQLAQFALQDKAGAAEGKPAAEPKKSKK